jgi:parvulin-like peptidyl-prolyl isomerase
MGIKFSTEELITLRDILDAHLEGMQEARERMINDDATLDTFDKFVETMQEHEILNIRALMLREKVDHELRIST